MGGDGTPGGPGPDVSTLDISWQLSEYILIVLSVVREKMETLVLPASVENEDILDPRVNLDYQDLMEIPEEM